MAKIPRKSRSSDGLTVATSRVAPVLLITFTSMKAFRLIPARHCACEQKGSMRRRTPSAAKLGAGHFKAAPSAIHHLKHTLRLSPKRFAFSAGEIVYFA